MFPASLDSTAETILRPGARNGISSGMRHQRSPTKLKKETMPWPPRHSPINQSIIVGALKTTNRMKKVARFGAIRRTVLKTICLDVLFFQDRVGATELTLLLHIRQQQENSFLLLPAKIGKKKKMNRGFTHCPRFYIEATNVARENEKEAAK